MFHLYAEDGYESAHRSLESAKRAAKRGSKRRGLAYTIIATDAYGLSGGGHGFLMASFRNGLERAAQYSDSNDSA